MKRMVFFVLLSNAVVACDWLSEDEDEKDMEPACESICERLIDCGYIYDTVESCTEDCLEDEDQQEKADCSYEECDDQDLCADWALCMEDNCPA